MFETPSIHPVSVLPQARVSDCHHICMYLPYLACLTIQQSHPSSSHGLSEDFIPPKSQRLFFSSYQMFFFVPIYPFSFNRHRAVYPWLKGPGSSPQRSRGADLWLVGPSSCCVCDQTALFSDNSVELSPSFSASGTSLCQVPLLVASSPFVLSYLACFLFSAACGLLLTEDDFAWTYLLDAMPTVVLGTSADGI